MNSFAANDKKMVVCPLTWKLDLESKYTIESIPVNIQIKLLEVHLELLEIFEGALPALKPFRKIFEHFFTPGKEQQSCELCLKEVETRDCKYVFHSLLARDFTTMCREKVKEFYSSQIEDGKAYITYMATSGFKVICNVGDCKDMYGPHIHELRAKQIQSFVLLMTKYRTMWTQFQCWFCKIYSRESHRCSTCKSRQYCSEDCQNKDWKIHQLICSQLKAAGTQLKTDVRTKKENGKKLKDEKFREKSNICRCGKVGCLMFDTYIHKRHPFEEVD